MKKYLRLIHAFLFCCSLICCKKYSQTIPVCNGNLYVEEFKHKFIDAAYDYLTDSSTFRIYIGEFDYEHAYYRYNCQNDSIEIFKTYEGKTLDYKKYSLLDLRKRNDFIFLTTK